MPVTMAWNPLKPTLLLKGPSPSEGVSLYKVDSSSFIRHQSSKITHTRAQRKSFVTRFDIEIGAGTPTLSKA